MRTFLVCYDLSEPAFNKADVVSTITMAATSWARPLENVWYIRTEGAQQEVEDRLRQVIGLDDGLVIQAVRDEAVLMNTGLRWFRQRRVMETPAIATDNVVAFPGSIPANDTGSAEPVRVAS